MNPLGVAAEVTKRQPGKGQRKGAWEKQMGILLAGTKEAIQHRY